MAQRASMKVCPNCAAPNPMQKIACFSCGYVLDNPAAAVPTKGVALRQSDDAVLPGGSPPFAVRTTTPGWAVETLPDASVRLRRVGWRRFFDDVTLPAVCLLFGGALLGLGLGHGHADSSASRCMRHLLGAAFLIFGTAVVAWQFGAREEIHAGRGFFERTMSLGPIVRRWRFDHAAEIYIDTTQTSDKTGDYTYRRLLVRQLGKKMTLDRSKRLDSLIRIGRHAPVVEDEISLLGRFLSEVTGWPCIDPAVRRFR